VVSEQRLCPTMRFALPLAPTEDKIVETAMALSAGTRVGAYFPLGRNPARSRAPAVELYWVVIGAIAKIIDVDLEGLTLVVLTHELAHAYSHLGADKDGNRWNDKAFCQADVEIKEGVAQYYTEKVVSWLAQRNVESPYHTYAEL